MSQTGSETDLVSSMRQAFKTERRVPADRNQGSLIFIPSITTLLLCIASCNSNMELQKYHKLELIGEGSSAQIFKVIRKQDGRVLAAKVIRTDSKQQQLSAIEQQVQLMNHCSHPNIIECQAVELGENEVWLILEYCPEGSLSDIIKRQRSAFKETQIAEILRQTLTALAYLHQEGIVHRDIKASNLLKAEGKVKISDFGIAMRTGEPKQEVIAKIGSPFWMSPQILSHNLYGPAGDIWALGITAIELAEGAPPYSHQHPFRAIYSIQTHPPQGLSQPQLWSAPFNSFVQSCLTLDSSSRPSALRLLEHPFLEDRVCFSSQEASPSSVSFSEQNTIIMHDELPKSIWEKNSANKEGQDEPLNDTVVVNQSPLQLSLFSNLKNYQAASGQLSNQENRPANRQQQNSLEKRDQRARQLYRQMEKEIATVRRKYLGKIKELYLPVPSNWESPVGRLKNKNRQVLRTQHSRLSSQLLRRML